jgi:hypothetical protein
VAKKRLNHEKHFIHLYLVAALLGEQEIYPFMNTQLKELLSKRQEDDNPILVKVKGEIISLVK